MQKLFIFACLLANAVWAAELYYTPAVSAASAYYAPLPLAVQSARSSAYVPVVYSSLHPTVETYNSVHTPNSFQQQYRSDYKPVIYEFIRR